MRRLSLTALIGASLASGCVVYDNDCPADWEDDGLTGDHDRPDWGDSGGADDDDPTASYSLDPNVAEPGDVFIGSLTSDLALNYESITEIEFATPDVAPCTFQARSDELLITVGVEEFAALGSVDMIIRFEDGSADYVESIFEIVEDASNGGSGGDGGGDDGGGDDGSGDGGTGGNGGICG